MIKKILVLTILILSASCNNTNTDVKPGAIKNTDNVQSCSVVPEGSIEQCAE